MEPVSLGERSLATQFVIAARHVLRDGKNAAVSFNGNGRPHTGRIDSMFKAAVSGGSLADGWQSNDGKVVADAFFGSLAPISLIDAAIAAGAKRIPENVRVGIFASGATAGGVAEGIPVAVTRLGVNVKAIPAKRASALVVTSQELANCDDGGATKIIADELKKQVAIACNATLLASLTSSTATGGTTALDNLQAGLAAAEDSTSYVVAASPADVRALSLVSYGRMGIYGGEFVQGVRIVPCAVAHMTVIPVDSLAIIPMGSNVEPVIESREASVQMSDSPSTGATTVVSLFQTGSVAVMVHRAFAVRGNCVSVQ